MTYPQYPQPGAYPVPPAAPAQPRGGTAITAGVLAALGGLLSLGITAVSLFFLIVIASIGSNFDRSDVEFLDSIFGVLAIGLVAVVIIALVLGTLLSVLLIAGAVLLFRRKMLGRWLVVSGCAVAIVSNLMTSVFTTAVTSDDWYSPEGVVSALLGLAFPIITMVLALLPSTTAWIRAEQGRAVPQHFPQYPPSYQG
ncbi:MULTISPECIES: hypothetical protein [Mycobacteriaceae]|uniref:Uncharacterized protein n=1 Tax=Mycolicibacterium mucogenicum TaxID=56689 RepID=A0A1A0N495_MYCMU|nr:MULTISPECIES: hypothetical protein [Mycolicibacterium]MCX8555435.1 hypothetical protein [Mycolicibacterium mucogenicum]OBA91853.1 hypothetical protein A5642_00930 [Mycolicibacterium mucogenicum]TDK85143.1 hypothetical protein EUA03_23535 [Mycolicibacterium mucogenicum]GCA97370.1 hypothetical protein NCCNTM_10050 [Mycolicibacterium sp. NCC-Tsukiji]